MSTNTANSTPQKRAAPVSTAELPRKETKSGNRTTRVQTVTKRNAPVSPESRRTKPRATRRVPNNAQKPKPAASRLETTEASLDDGRQFSVAHAFILLGYFVGIALVLVFGSDLLAQIPFDRASISYDIANVAGGLTLVYLSWNCQRDLK